MEPQSNPHSIERIVENEPSSSKLFENLLESTLSQGGGSLSSDEWAKLRQVLLGLASENLALEELTKSVVQSFLSHRFPDTLGNSSHLGRMSESIARTLCSDPTSKQRLVDFFQYLKAANRG